MSKWRAETRNSTGKENELIHVLSPTPFNSFPASHDHHTFSLLVYFHLMQQMSTNRTEPVMGSWHQMSQVAGVMKTILNRHFFSLSFPHLPSLPDLLCCFPLSFAIVRSFWHVCKKSRRKLSADYFHRFVFHRRDPAIFLKFRLC